MIWYNLKTAFRNIARNKSYIAINILGLTLSLTVVIAVAVWIKVELNTDNFHEDVNRIFCVANISKTPNSSYNSGKIYAPAGAEFKSNFPEIENMSRLFFRPVTIKKDNEFYTESTLFAEPDFFNIFSFKLLAGDVTKCLNSNNSVVISERLSEKLFGEKNSVGNELLVSNSLKTITGIVRDLPVNTDFNFDIILPTQIILDDSNIHKSWSGGIQFHTFIKISEAANSTLLEQKIIDYVNINVNKPRGDNKYSETPYLKSLKSIHLSPETSFGGSIQSSKLWLAGIIGVLILLIGVFNFINLSVALLEKRALSFGIKKVHGVRQDQIFMQIFSEIAIVCLFAFGLSILLFYAVQPLFINLLVKKLVFSSLSFAEIILMATILLSVIILLTSFFPAWKNSRQTAVVTILKNRKTISKTKGVSGIVSFQFAVSIALIAVVLTFYKQFNYIEKYDLGFNNENVVTLEMADWNDSKLKSFKNEILKQNYVINSALATNIPYDGNWVSSNGYMPEGSEEWMMIHVIDADKDYLETLGISLKTGKYFIGNSTDNDKIVINQSLVEKLGWKNPVGKKIKRGRNTFIVSGVVNNFCINSLHHKIEPLLITSVPFEGYGSFNNLVIKTVGSSNRKETISSLKSVWKQFYPETPMNYSFIEDVNEFYYGKEKKTNTLLMSFSLLAIFVACLGLFTMAQLKAQQRTKEIGIRKVNGAAVTEILSMLNIDFVKSVIVGFVIATPIAYYAMNKWLENFAYKTALSWWIFALAGLLALVIALLTVSFQSWRAATRNPVEALRYE